METQKQTGMGTGIGRGIPAVKRRRTRPLYRHWHLYLLILPGLLYFLVYRYLPMFGLVMAFQDFSPFLGFFDSPWVGLKHFRTMFEDEEALRVIWNTLEISLLQILFAFPLPIILALMINELRNAVYKRLIQSMVYLPHFLSWVVVVGIFVVFLKSDGIVNQLLQALGIGQIPFLPARNRTQAPHRVPGDLEGVGVGNHHHPGRPGGGHPQLYEAAVIDGANRWQQMWHITLPAIRSTIVILLILRLGSVMDTGFEQIFLMLNPFTMEVGNVLDTYVYFKGIQQGDISFATAVGLFKGAVGLILVVIANRLAKRFGEGGIY